MADRSFNSIFVVIAICICCTKLDVVLLQKSPPITYYDEFNNNDLAIQMEFPPKGGSFTLTIFFETNSDSAKTFFTKDVIAWLEKLNSCEGIQVIYSPCANAQFGADKKLTCPAKDDPCVDRFTSCVTNAVKDDPIAIGKFLLDLFFTGKTPDKCAVDRGMDLNSIKKCITNGTGDTKCFTFKNSFTNAKKKRSPSAGDIHDFGKTVCKKVESAKVSCLSACSEIL